MSDTVPKVYAAIAVVMAELSKEGIGKDRKNEAQGYKFRGIDDVFNALAPLLAKHQLIILPRVLSRSVTERITVKDYNGQKKESVLFYVAVEVEFDLVSGQDGSKHVIKTYGEAMDSGDKATNKAMSAAYKYAAIQAFCIPTEGDNDADAVTHEVAPRQQQERQPAFDEQQATALFAEHEHHIKQAATLDALGAVWANGTADRKLMPKEWVTRLAALKDARKAELTPQREPGDDSSPFTERYTPPNFDDLPAGTRHPAEYLRA